MERAYATIGEAVVFAQILEAAIVPLSEIFKMKSDPAYFEKTGGGFISEGIFKSATANIIKELEKRGGIDAGLQELLTAYIDMRHTLIHRWFIQKGWPADGDVDAFAEVIAFAVKVKMEARAPAFLFTSYGVKYGPPGADHNKLERTFLDAHLEGSPPSSGNMLGCGNSAPPLWEPIVGREDRASQED
ncbi:hypothetical protein [Cupriavidus pauculus]|uniref:Uncharacterized protein n=1 Tax=Cupriavidus pauculus TaxID=82633 RepID=A0A2N5C3L6_9BURK|nr:hypothetical protein [Cupriavidus pauculus]PLP96823.1 hypothetical protein CYJ10_29975 [Cupriavidus pauculus]